MKLNRVVFAGAAAVAMLAALASAPARANGVTWSVGVHAAPGVHIGATNAQPYYVIEDSNGKIIVKQPIGYTSKEEFIKFLDEGISNYKKP